MSVRIINGDCMEELRKLPAASVHMVVTSPPYWGLRDYGIPPSIWGGDPACAHAWGEGLRHTGGAGGQGESSQRAGRSNVEDQEKVRDAGAFCRCGAWRGAFGLEPNPGLYVEHTVMVFREVKRVLRDDGTLWLNLGDSYHNGDKGGYARDRVTSTDSMQRSNLGANFIGAPNRNPQEGLKPKDLCELPSDVVRALRADGWWLRSRIPWLKRNAMPESTKDRPTTAVEYIFLLSKSERYFYDGEGVKKPSSPGTHERVAYKTPDGWDTSAGEGGHGTIHKQGREKGTRKLAEAGSGTKNNTSFDEAMAVMPDTRARRNSDWFFESWQGMLQDEAGDPLALIVNPQPFKAAHFATFPVGLIEPCILAGTSEKGVCTHCGAPRARVVESGLTEHDGTTESAYPAGGTANRLALLRQAARERGEEYTSGKRTTGWQPTCKCGDVGTIPATVLDPFGGAGTTGLVAGRLQRNAILIELNADYVSMAEKRIHADGPLFANVVNT